MTKAWPSNLNNQTLQGLAEHDFHGSVLDANRAFESILGDGRWLRLASSGVIEVLKDDVKRVEKADRKEPRLVTLIDAQVLDVDRTKAIAEFFSKLDEKVNRDAGRSFFSVDLRHTEPFLGAKMSFKVDLNRRVVTSRIHGLWFPSTKLLQHLKDRGLTEVQRNYFVFMVQASVASLNKPVNAPPKSETVTPAANVVMQRFEQAFSISKGKGSMRLNELCAPLKILVEGKEGSDTQRGTSPVVLMKYAEDEM